MNTALTTHAHIHIHSLDWKKGLILSQISKLKVYKSEYNHSYMSCAQFPHCFQLSFGQSQEDATVCEQQDQNFLGLLKFSAVEIAVP